MRPLRPLPRLRIELLHLEQPAHHCFELVHRVIAGQEDGLIDRIRLDRVDLICEKVRLTARAPKDFPVKNSGIGADLIETVKITEDRFGIGCGDLHGGEPLRLAW
jgi:hypothetical protein